MLLDNDGNAVNNITYDTFGGVTIETNPDLNFRFGYTGRENDDETGLDYYGARYRDASVGRFISEDNIGFGGGDPNLYRYTFNSPLNYTDPNGNFALPVVAVGAAAAVVGVVGIWYLSNEFQKLLEPPGTVVDFPPYVPPTAENTDEDEKKAPIEPKPDPTPKPIPLPFPTPKNPNDCDDEDPDHRGRIQAQGGKTEKSVPWARKTPPTKTDGLLYLKMLKTLLTKKELKDRQIPLNKAEKWINSAGQAGGVSAPVSKTFLKKGSKDIRIDIEVNKGTAFIPG